MNFKNEHLYAPFFIFIKCGKEVDEVELLEELGINTETLELTTAENHFDSGVYLTQQEEWLHLMDNWLYTLWYSKTIRSKIELLARKYDIFYCSVGDIDHSFDFVYYQGGKLRRKYVVVDPTCQKREIETDMGDPFPEEAAALEFPDAMDVVIKLARSIGVSIHHTPENLRFYSMPDTKPEFIFNESEY